MQCNPQTSPLNQLAVLLGRVNLQRPTRRAVKPAVQHVVWFAGLRGGIAFALGLAAMSDFGCRVPTCLCIIKQELPEGQSTYGFGGELECSEESYSPWKTVEVEGWEELVEAFRAQARERLEHAGMAGKLGVANHSSFCVDGAMAS